MSFDRPTRSPPFPRNQTGPLRPLVSGRKLADCTCRAVRGQSQIAQPTSFALFPYRYKFDNGWLLHRRCLVRRRRGVGSGLDTAKADPRTGPTSAQCLDVKPSPTCRMVSKPISLPAEVPCDGSPTGSRSHARYDYEFSFNPCSHHGDVLPGPSQGCVLRCSPASRARPQPGRAEARRSPADGELHS